MAEDRYAEFVSAILDWIQRTLNAHAGEKRSTASFNFKRLPRYFSRELLNSANVVVTDHLPRPPLSALGLREFASFEKQPMSGITYLDTYFLEPDAAADESLHFHELVHVVQWQVLGPRDFLLLYAVGLLDQGYSDSPLEKMAYDHQRRFSSGEPSYMIEAEVRKQTLAVLDG